MKTTLFLGLTLFISLLIVNSCGKPDTDKKKLPQKSEQEQQDRFNTIDEFKHKKLSAASGLGRYTISKPLTYKNLSIYLIRGKDRIEGNMFLTLEEAIEQKKVIIHETGNVNVLAAENKSKDEDIYILSGSILKKGKQDRVIQYDYVLSPQSGKIQVNTFSLGKAIWQSRESESISNFEMSKNLISSKELKLSVKKEKSQMSQSSLQLTLENKDLNNTSKEYLNHLSKIIEGEKNVIGYSFAINGKINSSDIFGSHILFNKLWSKLLEASVVEAISKYEKGEKFTEPKTIKVKRSIEDAEKGKKKEKTLTNRVLTIEKESKNNYLFETTDKQKQGKWFRKNYIKK